MSVIDEANGEVKMDILIKNIELKGSLLLTPKAIFKPVEGHDHEKIVQKWEIVKEAEIVPVPEHGDLIDRDALVNSLSADDRDIYVEELLNDSAVVLERTT